MDATMKRIKEEGDAFREIASFEYLKNDAVYASYSDRTSQLRAELSGELDEEQATMLDDLVSAELSMSDRLQLAGFMADLEWGMKFATITTNHKY